jgi:alkylation response protein AidB-like acyl-CoA dehydrogenase
MSDDTLTMLADAAAAFAKPDSKRIRALRGSGPGFDINIWRQMAEQGWFSVLVPEDAGGLGLRLDAAATIAERLGFAIYPEPFVAAGVLTTLVLTRGDNPALAAPLLEGVMAGERVVTVAWQNDAGDLSGAAAGVSERGGVLEGSCRFVRVAAADVFVVGARGQDGLSLYALERARAGLSVGCEATADGGSNARLALQGVRVTPADRVASPVCAAAALGYATDAALLCSAAELVGIMERVLELTFEYLRTRKQFGKAIGSFQALQHRAVDIWIQKEVSKAALAAALRRFDADGATPRDRAMAASSAKSRAADAAMLVCKQAVQLHGAIGFTDEYDLSLYFNRALVLCAWLGNGAAHRRRFGELSAASGEAA